MTTRQTIAVVGGGWAGLAAAVEATRLGHAVTLFEMAPQLGGRARSVEAGGLILDNGQHILIGAYVETLRLMRAVGVDVENAFFRTPLRITYPEGAGLQLEPGPAVLAFGRAVLRQHGWSWADRFALLATAAGWALRGFGCDAAMTVAELTRRVPAKVRHELIDPLCVAALNTASADASAQVFLRVMKDALFSGPGSADLLLPRAELGKLLPAQAATYLAANGATVRLAHRVARLQPRAAHWLVDGAAFDRVVLACTPGESARLVRTIAPAWAEAAASLRYEPIVTVYLRGPPGLKLAEPMLALREDEDSPAQFVFDRGQLGGPAGLLAFVVSGAGRWVERGTPALEAAVLSQARKVLGASVAGDMITLTEKRATFRCTPALRRAPMEVAPGLHVAGDHVEGPYPATLEAAVRSGLASVRGFEPV